MIEAHLHCEGCGLPYMLRIAEDDETRGLCENCKEVRRWNLKKRKG